MRFPKVELRRRYRRARELEEAHPERGRVDRDCEGCKGSGVYQASRDPAQHHDWWVVGGRRNGLLGTRGGLSANVGRLEGLPDRVCPAAVVTPEGDWYEGPMVVARGLEFREPSDIPEEETAALLAWKRTLAALAERYRGHLAVAIDCHS